MPQKKQPKPQKDDELAALTDDLQRLQADFINYKRRAEEERQQVINYAKREVISDLLPVIDNLELATGHMPDDLINNHWAKGVEQVSKQIGQQLEQMGIKRIATVGQEFDPNLHEALQMEDGDGDKEIVAEELQAGYVLGDQVIRHAKVKVKRS